MPFEDLGVDNLLIDEAHAYKKVSIMTNMRNVRGVPNDESQRAMGLEMKTAQIQRRTTAAGWCWRPGRRSRTRWRKPT
jgi:N12 class adenine-specific DNA methylase